MCVWGGRGEGGEGGEGEREREEKRRERKEREGEKYMCICTPKHINVSLKGGEGCGVNRS